MLRSVLIGGSAILAIKLLYDAYIAPSVPDRVLLKFGDVELDNDDLAFAALAALAAPAIASALRGAV